MLEKILNFIEKNKMLSRGDSVICGFSGGADSTVLLHVMTALSGKLGITVKALHVNHCIRGKESDDDEEFCRDFCENRRIPFIAVRCNVPEYAKACGLSEEEAARELRYRAFAEHSAGMLVATAHNADDNLETAVHNLIRGTALKGLTGIPPKRKNIIRPLLTVSRREIEKYAAENNLSYVTDSTNLSNDCTRNKIRHRLIPLMRELNGSLTEKSVSSMDALREENSFIEAEAEKAYMRCFSDNSLIGIADYPPVIRKRCAARLLSENSLPYSYDRLEMTDSIIAEKGKINISKNLYFVSDRRSLFLKRIEKTSQTERSVPLKIGDNSIFGGISVKAEIVGVSDMSGQNVDINSAVYYLDFDKLSGKLTLRNRRYGDKIRIAGKNCTSSVKKLINEKVSTEYRSTLHFIDDSEGTVFAERLGVAERVAPDGSTVRFLKITVEKNRDEPESQTVTL